MDGIWHFSTKEHNRKKEFLNLDNTKEETVIKTEVKDDIFESEIEFIDETRYYNIKNEPLNLNDIKEETTIQPGEENTFEGKIGLTTGIWGVFIKEDDKQKEFLNLNDIKEETVIKKELEDDIFEEEIKLNLKNINADVTDATYVELKKLKCKFCPQVYTSILDLSSHLKVHSERTSLPCSETKKKFECDICHKSHLREHSTSHREELQFECETYEQSFSQNSQSSQKTDDIVIESHNEQNPSNQRHMVTVRVDNKDVLKKARQQRYRERHREEINKRKRASALNKERERRQFLQNEQRIATGQITEATSNDQVDKKDALKKARQQRYRERHREKINNRERERRQHQQNEQRLAPEPTESTLNDQVDNQNALRKARNQRYHEEINKRSRDQKLNQVDNKDALKKARQQRYRERHREEINKRKRVGRLYQGDSMSHHTLQAGERPFECPICSKFFVQKADLSRHFRIHTEVYKCQVCQNRFSVKDHLDKHMDVHVRGIITNIKRFS